MGSILDTRSVEQQLKICAEVNLQIREYITKVKLTAFLVHGNATQISKSIIQATLTQHGSSIQDIFILSK